MLTKREIAYLVTAMRVSAPLAKNYSEHTIVELRATVHQWRKCVENIASFLETAQEDAAKPTFNKRLFLKDCGFEDDKTVEREDSLTTNLRSF